MSVSPVHPDPACPDCHGEGAILWDPERDPVSAYPCGRCKARECHFCDAVKPHHEPDCVANKPVDLSDARLAEQVADALGSTFLAHRRAVQTLVGIVREFDELVWMDENGDREVCGEPYTEDLDGHLEDCLVRRARRAVCGKDAAR